MIYCDRLPRETIYRLSPFMYWCFRCRYYSIFHTLPKFVRKRLLTQIEMPDPEWEICVETCYVSDKSLELSGLPIAQSEMERFEILIIKCIEKRHTLRYITTKHYKTQKKSLAYKSKRTLEYFIL